jgi:CubicO group peptidase (beta-lactamase class C family)
MASLPAIDPPSEDEQQRRFAPVYSLLEQAVIDGVFPGCTFGVIENDGASGYRIAALDAVGRQTYDAGSPGIAPGTAYDLASLTKVTATTAMAMLLHQRQLLDLDLPVVDILPGFACGLSGGLPMRSEVTIRHLMAHNSGLAGYARLFEAYSTPEMLFEACLCMPLEMPPGARAEYSDIGFILLGRALELVAGDSLEGFCRREIFAPLGMTSACFRPAPSLKTSIPPTEDDRVFRHRVIQGEVQDENCWVLGGVAGHAGLFGNAVDLLRFSVAMLAPPEVGLFAAETVNLFATRVGQPAGSSRALGWDTPSVPSSGGAMFAARSIGHLGYSGTSLWIDLEGRCAVVLLSNRTWPTRENQQIKGFRPAFHDAVRKCLLPSTTSA